MSFLIRRAIKKSVGINVSEVFSVDLWTGPNQTVTNGIDSAANDSLVWIKDRNAVASSNLMDTIRGVGVYLRSDATNGDTANANIITSFNNDGYSMGSAFNPNPNVGWQFRKAPKFFDVIKYSGDGVAGRQIAHSLGVQAGFVTIKRINSSTNWIDQHVTAAVDTLTRLNLDGAEVFVSGIFDGTSMDNSSVTLGNDGFVNAAGGEYVMYVFAHDTSPEGLIQCGRYTGNGSAAGPSINLGWTPQFALIKRATGGTGDWQLIDTTRGWSVGNDARLFANLRDAEISNIDSSEPTATGFKINTTNSNFNANGSEYIYIAIREE